MVSHAESALNKMIFISSFLLRTRLQAGAYLVNYYGFESEESNMVTVFL